MEETGLDAAVEEIEKFFDIDNASLYPYLDDSFSPILFTQSPSPPFGASPTLAMLPPPSPFYLNEEDCAEDGNDEEEDVAVDDDSCFDEDALNCMKLCYQLSASHFNRSESKLGILELFTAADLCLGPNKDITCVTEFVFNWDKLPYFTACRGLSFEFKPTCTHVVIPLWKKLVPEVPDVRPELDADEADMLRFLAVMHSSNGGELRVEVRTEYTLNRTLFHRVFFQIS